MKDRIGEIGIPGSIGTTRGEVRRIFINVAVVPGCVGAIIWGIFSFIIGYVAVSMMIGSTDYYFSPESLIYVPYGNDNPPRGVSPVRGMPGLESSGPQPNRGCP